jgi:molybdopterin converting factor small subunit
VTEILDAAVRRFGDDFAVVLARCRVWVNGEPADPAGAVGAADEVAILPPVSGGGA